MSTTDSEVRNLKVNNELRVASDKKIHLRDDAIYASSKNDGYYDLDADLGVRVNAPLTANDILIGSVDAITATSEGVAASVVTLITNVTTNGDADLDNVTLANGVAGQVKVINCIVEGAGGDTWKVTPATMAGGTQITFATVGEGCILVYNATSGWVVTGNNGGTIS